MTQLYSRTYLKIYFWQFLSFGTSLLSFFIVSPKLANQPSIYGIYSVCIATSIFLNYADIGFIGAAYKYASENYARNEREEEMKIFGFSGFILMIFVFAFSVTMLFISFFPSILIKDLSQPSDIQIASQLLVILSLTSPITTIGRIIGMIFSIRLEDYIPGRISIIFNLLTIASVYFFFNLGTYDIVGYYLFSQTMTISSLLISILVAKKKYHYNFIHLLKLFRYSKETFNKIKNFAFTTLFTTIMAILYFEIDLVVIGPLFGAEIAALYQIGFTFFTFWRNIINILFSPFYVRFNHLIGIKDSVGLKTTFSDIVIFLFPFTIIPLVTFSLYMKSIIFTWVGPYYAESILIGQFLTCCYLLHSFSLPGNNLLLAKEELKPVYKITGLSLVVFWCGIACTLWLFGALSFALFKFICLMVAGIYYFIVTQKFLNVGSSFLVKKLILPLVPSLLFLVLSSFFISGFLPLEKGLFNLAYVFGIIVIIIGVAILIFYLISSEFRKVLLKYIKDFLNPNKSNLKTDTKESV